MVRDLGARPTTGRRARARSVPAPRGGRKALLAGAGGALAAAVLAGLAVGGCGAPGAAACLDGAACGDGTACGLDGRCAPLEATRFARVAAVHAVDWVNVPAVRPTARGAASDRLVLGGPDALEAVLRLPDAVVGAPAERAVLVLSPAPEWPGPTAEGALHVRAARPFGGDVLPRGAGAPRPLGPAASRAFAAGHGGRFLVDVTPLFAGGAPAAIVVTRSGGGPTPWRFVSPAGREASARPVLELAGSAAQAAGARRVERNARPSRGVAAASQL